MADFTHLNATGQGTMVDVSTKDATARVAVTTGEVKVSAECAEKLNEETLREIYSTARVAGISAAKQTSSLIPFCHQIALSKADVVISFDAKARRFLITAETKTTSVTGVEMEALVAVQIAAATIYDMIKAVDPAASLGPFNLREKTGGKNGPWINQKLNQH